MNDAVYEKGELAKADKAISLIEELVRIVLVNKGWPRKLSRPKYERDWSR